MQDPATPAPVHLTDYQSFISPLFTAEELSARCEALGRTITQDYQGLDLVIVGVLKGVFPFFADLVRQINLPCQCDFLGLSSYGSRTRSSGVVRMTSDLSVPVNHKHVLIVEDIVDTGLTMNYLMENMRTRSPSSVRICTLLHKPSNEIVKVPLDYVGFVIEDHFVLGYGLDYKERFRNLPYIGYFGGEIPEINA
jgi:hypoxanthine phosphoribosyltransferase